MRWGSVVSRFPDSPDSPSKTAPFSSLRPRAFSDYFSLEDKVVFANNIPTVFWRYGAYKKYPRSYGAWSQRVESGRRKTSAYLRNHEPPANTVVVQFHSWRAPAWHLHGRCFVGVGHPGGIIDIVSSREILEFYKEFENRQEVTTLTVIWARQLVSPQPKLGPVP